MRKCLYCQARIEGHWKKQYCDRKCRDKAYYEKSEREYRQQYYRDNRAACKERYDSYYERTKDHKRDNALKKREIWREAYSNAKQRCTYVKGKFYHRYGGRGIQVKCTLQDFENLFKAKVCNICGELFDAATRRPWDANSQAPCCRLSCYEKYAKQKLHDYYDSSKDKPNIVYDNLYTATKNSMRRRET